MLIATTLVSLDGYCEGPGGDLTALPFDPAFDLHNAELMAAADTVAAGA
ncbi:hypothetical protein ACFQV2_30675 [Actinokineospora soli]|uniref:RibD C-terminal domain-containing protein n=1 Tax=Actinokineospora soli TaxID=1048753 RepID=A0ABW2TTU3_9PSEU